MRGVALLLNFAMGRRTPYASVTIPILAHVANTRRKHSSSDLAVSKTDQ